MRTWRSRWGPSASATRVADSSTSPISSSSARMARVARARPENRAPLSVNPAVAEIVSSSWCASSTITTSASGRIGDSLDKCRPSRWVFTTTTSACAAARRACSVKQTSPFGHRCAPGHSRGPTLTASHRLRAGLEGQLGAVAGVGFPGPGDQRVDLVVDLQVELIVVVELGDALEARVVRAALEDGVRERDVEVLGEEREVLRRPAGPAAPWWRSRRSLAGRWR